MATGISPLVHFEIERQSHQLAHSIRITTVAVDFAAKATSVDNFLDEVVPVITKTL
jgi:hypothetical protein